MLKSKHFWISGRVQGVFYRASTGEKARSLKITGWARNLSDGRVEVVATGEETALSDFEKWLWQGPENARVESVVVREESLEEYDSFTTRH